ncbi:protein FAM227A [Alligator sinensis]|uniref:Protein FAM227A n=1 Tax=Alligator sinensis TaxID=38654 RepID=A0A1U7SG43_ALLSI|nr:protein FAM227A [Alligator sinensis]
MANHTASMTSFGEFLGILPLKHAEETDTSQQGLDEKPSKCLIGSMQEVNKKIARFELDLKRYHGIGLVLEDLESSKPHTIQKSFRREKKHYQAATDRDKDRKESQAFVHKHKHSVPTLDVDLLPQTKATHKKSMSEKDKLVELYQYPGYNEHEPTALPNETNLAEVVEKVVRAQRKPASGKIRFPQKKLRMFLTAPLSQAVLLDSFWWFFLQLYQPNQEIQARLFDRIAKNYASLLLDCHKFRHQEALIKAFPSLLSQALYTCFCSSFPGSWFNTDEFKSQLCNVLSEWMAGTLPVPGTYTSWDYSQLEPERFRREDLLSTKRKQSVTSFPFASFKTSGSLEKTHQPSIQPWKPNPLMQVVNKCQPGQRSLHLESREAVRGSMSLKGGRALPCDLQFKKNHEESGLKQTQHVLETRRPKITSLQKESHPACRGPEFTWHLFNINGHSPLIQHFLQSYKAEPQAGQDILIHRREIYKPIPESSPTYADIIQQSFHHLRQLESTFKNMYQRHCREMRDFDKQQQKEKQEFLRKEKQLLLEKGKMKTLNQLLPPHLDVLCSSDKTSGASRNVITQDQP